MFWQLSAIYFSEKVAECEQNPTWQIYLATQTFTKKLLVLLAKNVILCTQHLWLHVQYKNKLFSVVNG